MKEERFEKVVEWVYRENGIKSNFSLFDGMEYQGDKSHLVVFLREWVVCLLFSLIIPILFIMALFTCKRKVTYRRL